MNTIELKVPSISCSACANTISTEIKNNLPSAKVEVDVDSKVVTVESEASLETIKEMITGVGHTVE